MFFKKEKKLITIDLPQELVGKDGIFAIPVNSISLDASFSGSVLCVQDNPKNISDLGKIKNLHLQVKAGGVNTSYGMIMFLLFRFWDIKKEKDKFIYEVLVNPNDIESYEQYLIIDKQKEWKVLMVDGKHVLNTYTFKNIYNIREAIKKAVASSKDNPCLNFSEAKNEYFRDYSIEELIISRLTKV